ncbi:hypothetical protein LguiA_028410 [Lonicera macranthoides]
MAAFNHPFLFDSVFSPRTTAFSEEPNTISNITTTPYIYKNYPADPLQNISPVVSNVYESSCPGNSNTRGALSSKNAAYKQSTDSSSVVVDKLESDDQVTQNLIPMEKKRKYKGGSCTSPNSAQSKDKREVVIKGKRQKNKRKDEEKIKKKNKLEEKEAAPIGYIHVRARRGQATDSHSLAERVRREKISERMKLLQSLVPGCDKVTGKALMLDEIINYVQSLQNQVEFLSAKLGSVNPMMYDFGLDLDSFMVRPDHRLGSLESTMANVQQSQLTAFSHDGNNIFTTSANNNANYPLVDTSVSLLLQQAAQFPNIILSQSNGQLLWDVDGQSQRNIISQSTEFSNLCFH